MIDAPSVALAKIVLEKLDKGASLDELKELKREMVRRRFHSPPMFLIKAKGIEKEDNEAELADRKKQMKIIREIVTLKKLAYSATSLYIYAEKLRNSLSPHLAQHIPEKGNYVSALASLRYNGVLAFRDIYVTLSTFGEREEVRYFLVEDAGLTYVVRESYAVGMGLNIKKTKKKSRISPLIRSPFVRKLLAASAVAYAYGKVTSSFEEDDEELREYNKVLASHGVPPYSRVDHLEDKDALKEELSKKGFGTFEGGSFSTDEALVGKVTSRRSYFFNSMKELASKELAKEIALALKDRRIPSLARNPTPIQLKALHYLDPSSSFEEVFI